MRKLSTFNYQLSTINYQLLNGEWNVMKESIIGTKSFDFAVRIVRLYQYLNDKHEFVMSKQVLRSGTSIGANVSEALEAQSKRDYISKMSIALKEASETMYWLKLLAATDYLTQQQFQSIHNDAIEIKKILTAIIKTAKQRLEAQNE